jgi:hypothetical protein
VAVSTPSTFDGATTKTDFFNYFKRNDTLVLSSSLSSLFQARLSCYFYLVVKWHERGDIFPSRVDYTSTLLFVQTISGYSFYLHQLQKFTLRHLSNKPCCIYCSWCDSLQPISRERETFDQYSTRRPYTSSDTILPLLQRLLLLKSCGLKARFHISLYKSHLHSKEKRKE